MARSRRSMQQCRPLAAVIDASTSPVNELLRHLNEATQTCRGGRLLLPNGIMLKRLARVLFESPRTRVADQIYALESELPTLTSSGQLNIIETVLYGMEAMARTVISYLVDQRQDGRTSTAAADCARLAVLHQLGSLWNRSTEFHPPSEGEGAPSPPM